MSDLSPCCGAYTTWGDGGLFCKKCYEPVDAFAPPRAEDALSFDEAEAAGLDGTLRTVGVRPTCDSDLNLIRTETIQYRPLQVVEGGHVQLGEHYKEEVLDVESSSIWCDTCGLLGSDDYERHGIAEDWEER